MEAKQSRRPLWQDPLVHFVVFGALVFGVDAFIAARTENPNLIEVSAETQKDASELFRSSMGRAPAEAELKILRERWVDNEVLYREGLALGVDRGDASIRERVIFKALNVMQANLALPKIDEAGLRAWFEQHRGNYDEPARFDFLEAVLIGDATPEKTASFVEALNAGKQGDEQSGLRVFKARPRENLLTSYGKEFTESLEKMPPGQWRALNSKEGLRVIRLEAITPGAATSYEAVQGKVYDDWKDRTMQELRTAAVRELGKKYQVRIAGAAQ
jgi:hypothetical protein